MLFKEDINQVGESERILNFSIDFVLSSILGIASGFFVYKLKQSLLVVYLVFTVVRFLYYFLFEIRFGKTQAKFVTKTKVVDIKGEKPSINSIFIRSVLRKISLFPSFASDAEKAFHDEYSATKLVFDKSTKL